MQHTRPSTPKRIGFILTLVLLGWAAIGFYRSEIRYNIWPRNFGTVEPGKVFRAGALTPAMLASKIREHQIKTVIDLGAYEPGSHDAKQAGLTLRSLGVERFEFRLIGDGTGDPNNYVKALAVMTDPTKQPVLVHCATGAQRTSACVAFYRHTTQGKSLDEAYLEAQNFKHDPTDNPKLRPYIERWADPISRSFRSGQVITDTSWKDPAPATKSEASGSP